jgi:hypothetical protein
MGAQMVTRRMVAAGSQDDGQCGQDPKRDNTNWRRTTPLWQHSPLTMAP